MILAILSVLLTMIGTADSDVTFRVANQQLKIVWDKCGLFYSLAPSDGCGCAVIPRMNKAAHVGCTSTLPSEIFSK